MKNIDATEIAYKNGYEAGKRDAVKVRWQPSGKQFAYTCKVCKHGPDLASDICRNCLCEKEPGFEFDCRMYLVMQQKLEEELRRLRCMTQNFVDYSKKLPETMPTQKPEKEE